LYLNRTSVDDDGLEQLETISTLRTLDIRFTPTTPEGVARFKQARRECRVEE
jgi:hypothetical protein